MDKIARLFAEVSADASKFDRTMKGVDSKLMSSSKRFSNFTTGIVQGFGQAFGQATIQGINNVAGAFAGIIGGASNTEQQVADIRSILMATEEEGDKIKNLLNDLAVNPKLKVSLSEAGQLTEMLARNGVDAQAIIDGMAKSTILLSNATKGDFGQAADILTDVMALWGELGLDAENAVNSITSVINKSKLNLNEYQFAITNVAGVASNLKIPFEDVNAALISTASFFKSGRVQGTSFNAFLKRLVPTTDSAKDAFDELGLRVDGVNQLFDDSGQLKDFGQIAGMLQKAISGLSDESAIELLSAAFGTTASDFLLGISKVGQEGFKAIKEEAGKVSAEVNAAVVTDTTLSKWETFKDALIGLGNTIGDKFLPALKRLIEGFIDLSDQKGKEIVSLFDGLAESFSRFVDFLLANKEVAVKFIDRLISSFISLAQSIPFLVSWLRTAKDEFTSFVQVVKSIVGPIGETLENLFNGLTINTDFSFLKDLMTSIANTGILSDSSLANFAKLGENIMTIISNGIEMAIPLVKKGWSLFVQWLTSPELSNQILNHLSSAWTFFSQWADTIWGQLQPRLVKFFSAIWTWVTDSNNQQKLLDGLVKGWTFFVDWAKEVWSNVQPNLTKYGKELIAWITDNQRYQDAWKGITSIWTWFTDWAGGIWDNILPKLQDLWLFLRLWISQRVPKFTLWENAVTNWISNTLAQLKTNFPIMKAEFETFVGGVGNELQKIGDSFTRIFDVIFGEGGSKGQGFANMLTRAFSSLLTEIEETISAARIILELIASISEAIDKVSSGDLGGFSDFFNAFKDSFSELNQAGEEARRDTLDWLNNLLGTNFQTPNESQGVIGASSLGSDRTIQVNINDAQNLPQNREVIDQLAQALQRELNLTGVRVTT